ncbi:MAG: Fic family protein [Magnetococcales bacterium]|nr:Fic family protein [Magnetococcales bacterium]
MYNFISGLYDNTATLRNPELDALAEIWRERRKGLVESGEYQEFNKKLEREWAIETGIIERLYTWDRGVTEVLIEQGIEATLITHRGGMPRHQAETVAAIIQSQENVVEGLFSFVKNEQPLTEHYIRQLHAEFTTHQDAIMAQTADGQWMEVSLLKGQYKKHPNNPLRKDGSLHSYCPPEHVQQEMQHLVSWFDGLEKKREKPEVLSAFLHHRFTQIHPFQDGNGRVARALASIVFLKHGLFPLVIRDSERTEYIDALEGADGGNLKSLCDLFARNQKKSILAAFSIEQSVQQARHARTVLNSGLQLLKNRFKAETGRMDEVFNMAERLRVKTNEQLDLIVQEYQKEFAEISLPDAMQYNIYSLSDGNRSEKRDYFRSQITTIAAKHGYFANLNKHCGWASLAIKSLNHFQFVVAFHGLGPVHRGIMAASSFTLFRIPREGDPEKTDVIGLHRASPDFFQFNYVEPMESVERRFDEWLDSSLAIGLAEWQKAVSQELGT